MPSKYRTKIAVPSLCLLYHLTDSSISSVKKKVANERANGPVPSSDRFESLPRNLLEGCEMMVTLSPLDSSNLRMLAA